MERIAGLVALALVIPATAFANDPRKPEELDDLPEPQAEIVRDPPAVDLPAVPGFDLPPVAPGELRPRELRVHGKRMLDTAIKVRGYVTWIYDCETEIKRLDPSAGRQQIRSAMDRDPGLCSQPKFYLGDTRDTQREASIWVADVPGSAKIAIGDRVVVTGTWATVSPHAEHDTEGLLVFQALEPVPPGAGETWAAAAAAAGAASPAPSAADAAPAAAPAAPPVMRKAIDEQARNVSVMLTNACNRAIAARKFEDAITECRAATGVWDGNHLAWYGWASAALARRDWRGAVTAIGRAVALRPDRAMYQLYDGIARYEAAVQQARDDAAKAQRRKPDEVALDPSRLALDDARDALGRATQLMPGLWRAHYYLARIHRDLGDGRRAAEEFTQTLTAHPGHHPSYVALSELYRRWGHIDAAIAVALRGTERVRPTEAVDLWFEAGLSYQARQLDDQAIAAFTRVLAARPRDTHARFQRGQVHARRGDFASARPDLDEVVRSTDAALAPSQPIAKQLLHQMALQEQVARQPRPRANGRTVERLTPPKITQP